jgi:hypothetical protein
MRAGDGAGPGSSSRDRTLPVSDLLALPENGSQPSLSIRFSDPIWYYQFCMLVKSYLGISTWPLLSDFSFICLFSHDFPTQ